MIIPCYPDHETASLGLSALIVSRWGAEEGVLDALTIDTMPSPHEVGGGAGKVLMAYPAGQMPTRWNWCAVYYGDLPPGIQAYAELPPARRD